MEFVTTHEQSRDKYLLLKPGSHSPRVGESYNVFVDPSSHSLDDLFESMFESRILSLDFETVGGDYTRGIDIAGLGLAWDTGSCYFNWSDWAPEIQSQILATVGSHPGLIAHNIYFDAGVMLVNGIVGSWHMCTYTALAHLANEGHPGQGWGLKNAQVELLGWASSNEHDLDRWLVTNKYYIGVKRIDESYENLLSQFELGKIKPEKSEMWRAPKDILGKYCILDAEACYLLYMNVLEPALRKFPELRTFLEQEFVPLILHLVDQKLAGIEMDIDGLKDRRKVLESLIVESENRFLNHEKVAQSIREITEDIINSEVRAKEPAKLTVKGVVSKNWIKWNDKLEAALRGELPEFKFNMNSQQQMAFLLYEKLKAPVRIYTEKGTPGVGTKAYKHMGDIGKILTEAVWNKKELGFIDKYLELTQDRTTIHPSFRTPGTSTGRLSSKEPNLQQIPKTKTMMRLFRSTPGRVWVDLDFSALEPTVVTEFSGDENMSLIYGNGRPSNDIYLFVASSIPGMGEKIRAAGYDPKNPTKEALAQVKKQFKHERSICKTVVLACQYGAGVKKVMQTLEDDDIILDYDQVEQIHSGYWNLFAGVKDFGRSLLFEWKRNRGYILNGTGRPMAVPEEMNKDLLNRFIQSTGHDILVMYINILLANLTKAGINWSPVILDFHDATTVEVPEKDGERTKQIFLDSLRDLNIRLQGTIQLRGVPTIGTNLADVKEPEDD